MAEKGWIREHAVKTVIAVMVTSATLAVLAWLVPPLKGFLALERFQLICSV
jgi:hypothetical protein